MINTILLCLRFRVRPSTLRRALDNWRWRMASIHATEEESANLLAFLLDSDRRHLVELASEPRVPATWWDER